MSPILAPLFSVLGIMLLGAVIQKLKILPSETDQVLNQYVYYIAFPAIMLFALAQTPIEEILQWGFIAGYSIAMLITYLLVTFISLKINKARSDIAAVRALNTTFGNTAFIGIPLLAMIFPAQQSAFAAAAIASLLSVVVFAIVLVTLELYRGEKTQPPLITVTQSLLQNPIVIGSAIGITLSALQIELFNAISIMIKQIGMSSSPCALFAIGMVLAKARDSAKSPRSNPMGRFAELGWINLCKLLIQPMLAYILLSAFSIEGDYLIMGVILASLPTAASVYLLAQRYQVQAQVSAQAIVAGTLLSILTLPVIDALLRTR
ncbi:AEC family transporter [uncultured Shewanella sp.]|uniref:AEC family transporter n=1 Tax=Shewanella atlantica TaxID=271099 RepID=UPI0026189A6D|nr:AEC family transporter [uncultured Shewanella sp.]